MSKYASRTELLKKAPRRYRDETLPVSGLRIRIQSLTEKEYAEFCRAVNNKKDSVVTLLNSRRALLIRCLVDENGNRMFSLDDYDALAEWDAADLQAAQSACADHVGTSEDGLENIRKNSQAIAAAEPPSE